MKEITPFAARKGVLVGARCANINARNSGNPVQLSPFGAKSVVALMDNPVAAPSSRAFAAGADAVAIVFIDHSFVSSGGAVPRKLRFHWYVKNPTAGRNARMALRNRQNILKMPLAQVTVLTDAFNVLKANGSYDTWIKRHMTAMMTPTPAGSQSNAAHSGPIFLPWHRASLWELETMLLSVAPTLPGLPYWTWAAESALNGGVPARSKLWTAAYFGPDGDKANGDRVLTGPFKDWKALVYNSSTGAFTVRATPGLVRRLGRDPGGSTTLPDQAQVNDLFTYTTYDVAPYGPSTASFRSRLEGWNGSPRLHNQVHRWIGGDMLVGTSPNDPVFWLNHANVDRLWWTWQNGATPMRPYHPTSATGPVGQRVTDTMKFLSSTSWTPQKVLNITDTSTLGYTYS